MRSKVASWSVRIIGTAFALVCALLIIGFAYEKIGEIRDARKFPVPGTMFDVDGQKLHLFCKGEGNPTVVLVPGASSPSFQWFGVQGSVAEFTRACTYDRPGYGWSAPSPSPLSMSQHVKELHALLVEARIREPYVLVGHSYGGALVRLFARDYPSEVAGMVLVDSVEARFYSSPGHLEFEKEDKRSARIEELKARFGLTRFRTRNYPMPGPISWPELYRERAAEIGTLVSPDKNGSTGTLGNMPLAVIRHGVNFPASILPRDETAEQYEAEWLDAQKRLATLSTDSELVVARHSGHEVNLDQPSIIVDEINLVVAAIREHVPLSQSSGTDASPGH